MRRREVIGALGGAAGMLAAWAQQRPVLADTDILVQRAAALTEADPQSRRIELFRKAGSNLASGRAMEANHRFAEAIRFFQIGITMIGDDYVAGIDVIDDTPQKWLFAQSRLEEGRFSQAAALLEGVLDTRLKLFEEKYRIAR